MTEKFKPYSFYNEAGDMMECFLTTDEYYGEYINNDITIYRHIETHEIIGICLENITNKIKESKELNNLPVEQIFQFSPANYIKP